MTPRARRGLIYAATALLALVVLAPFAWVGLVVLALLTGTPEREPPRLARLPPGLARGDATLAAELRPAHPFLAEYDRALLILRGDAEAVRTSLPRDTGGFASLAVRAAADGTLRVEDRLGALLSGGVGTWVVDLAAPRIAPAPEGETPGRLLGAFRPGPGGTYRFVQAEGGPATP